MILFRWIALSNFFTAFLLLILLVGCSTPPPSGLTLENGLSSDEEQTGLSETPDHSCSYFYFLLGKHAENRKEYSEAQEAYEKALICDPESTYILNKLPLLLIQMGKYKGAAKWLREIIRKSPEDSSNRLLLAQLDVRNNEVEEAISLYKEVIALQPDDETSYLRLGALFSKQLRYPEAEEVFMQALSLNNQSFFAHLYLARLAAQSGEYDAAEKWYKKTQELNWSIEIAMELADFYEVLDKQIQAEALYRSILKKIPGNERAGLGLVHSLLLQEKAEEALQVLQRLRETSNNPERLVLITSRLHLRAGRLDKAEKLLQEIVDNDEAAYMLAVIYFEKKDIQKTLQTLTHIGTGSSFFEDSIILQVRIFLDAQQEKKAIALLQSVLDSKTDSSPGLYALLASLYLEQHEMEKSHETLNQGLTAFPESEQLYFEYGLLLEQEGRQEQAVKSMERVLEIEPEHAEALNYLGYTWANNNVNLDKALTYILLANSLKPDNGYILDSLGWVYFRRGELEKAVTEILAALKLEPKDPHIHEHLGDIYVKQGKEKDALHAYQQAEKLFTDQKKKNQLLEKIRAIEGKQDD